MPSVPRGLAVAFALFGVTLATGFLGPQGPTCLGPLGVTAIQCYAATGITPTAGLALPVSVAIIGTAALLMVGAPRDPRPAAVASLASALMVGVLYLALRPTELRGPTSDGTVISIALPLDPPSLAAAVIAGAFAGVVVASVAGRVRPRARSAGARR